MTKTELGVMLVTGAAGRVGYHLMEEPADVGDPRLVAYWLSESRESFLALPE